MRGELVLTFDNNELINNSFYENIKNTLIEARQKAYSSINFYMVEAYWNIGKLIVEEQKGEEKAEYGDFIIKNLSKELTKDFGKGFTQSNLRNMRQFYLTFNNSYALRSELSWTHYRLLMRLENEEKRDFYIDECIKSNWSTRQLERQINSFYYERLLASQNKKLVRNEIKDLETGLKPNDIIKDTYVLEFLDLKENKNFIEKDLEQGLMNNLQQFLLELGISTLGGT